MHLVINASELGRQRGGNESYIAGLLEGLAALQPAPRVSLLTCQWPTPPRVPPIFQQLNLGPYRRLPFFLWQQTRALRDLKADWYLANFFLPPLLPCKGAVVVHDMSFKAHPDYFPRLVAWYMDWLTAWSARRAQCVLTGSEFSRRELLRFYPIDAGKVTVTPYGIGQEFRPVQSEAEREADLKALQRCGVAPPYILGLGNIHPRKNLARLLDAYLLLRQRGPAPRMVWAGLQRWSSGELVERAEAAGVGLPGFVAQEDLPAFYRQAELLVYPSLYEGFGLPPAEAMACGTPVVASKAASLPEVVGEAGLLVDPYDVEAIAWAIGRILADAALRGRLREQGLAQVQQFRWERTAEETLRTLLNLGFGN
ncbi:MAG: glycosyltransferase family 4 protein [Thermoflexales bacterium]|nr:glycosyltransferase family 4 protein [Thermoflexales bacterium]